MTAAHDTFLIIDDQEIIAESLAYTLRGRGLDAHRVPVTDLDGIRAAVAAYPPGVVMLDLDLGGGPDGGMLDGVELIAPLRAQGWTVLVVTGTNDLDRIAAATAHGAWHWIVKSAGMNDLVATALATARGEGAMPPEERAAMEARYRQFHAERQRGLARMRRLSPRERTVLDHLADGATPADIAASSHTSLATVRNQIHSILTKLEVSSQVAAVAVAHRYRARRPPISARRWRLARKQRPGR